MISIIIPAYNAQAYLRECLESVLAQSYTDWEAIIVNDGSTDSTLDIALSYAALDPRFRVITTENRGVSAARNVAIQASVGEWITFLDSDDSLVSDALSALIRVTDRPDVDIVAGGWGRQPCDKDDSTGFIAARDVVVDAFYQTGIATLIGAKLYRKEIFKEISFPENLRYEDLIFFSDAFRHARTVALVSTTVYIYNDNPQSFINTFSPSRFDVLKVTKMIEESCAGEPELLRAARDRRLSANFNIYGLLSVHDREGRYREIKNQCWQLIKAYRLDSLRNPRVRLKNKVGILISYFGETVMTWVSKAVY